MNLKRARSAASENLGDENESSVWLDRPNSLRRNKDIESTICLNCMSKKENSDDGDEQNEFACIVEDFDDDYLEDFLDFDVIFSSQNKPKLSKSQKETRKKFKKKHHKKITAAEFSIVKENEIKPRSRKKRSKAKRQVQFSEDSPEIMGIDNVRFNDVTGDMYNDMDLKSDISGFGDTCNLGGQLALGGVNNNNVADRNMNADEEDDVSETSYIPESAILHQQQTAVLKKIFERKQKKKQTVDKERVSLPVATYEKYQLGPPFDGSYAVEKDPENPFCCLRHANEILAFCCENARCRAFCDIHKMVGASSFEVLRKLLKDILYFALNSGSVISSQKLLKRKKMMYSLYEFMQRKADLYEDEKFKTSSYVEYDGTYCNQLLTSILTLVEFILDITVNIRKDGRAQYIKKKERLYGRIEQQSPRCLFCAKFLRPGVSTNDKGCYDLERLVRFFKTESVAVAQKEINIEMTYKYTVQRFCATIVSNAMKEVSVELDDPPLVLACKVSRAMICKQLDKMLPKITSFKDMTADELRRVGSRRERIQARNDPTAGGNKIETAADKRRKNIISSLQDQLGTKWRAGLKENELDYCSKLLAQILVHEKIMGFSVYNGFLLKEHEEILASNRLRLIEIERKAQGIIKKIVRLIVVPGLRIALKDSDDVDVLFCSPDVEVSYLQESISVMQFNSEVTFLKTCCYYIDDIVNAKIEEFRYFAAYLKSFDPSVNLQDKLKASMFASHYKHEDKIEIQTMNNNSSLIAAPVLRWGFSAIKGLTLPKELKMFPYCDKHFKEKYQAAAGSLSEESPKMKIARKLVRARLKVKSYLDGQKTKKNKELRLHLAHVQAQMTEQIALLAQTVTSAFSLEDDYQREYSNDDLFNVEFYATKNLKLLFPTNVGHFLLFLLVVLTLVMIMLTTVKGGSLPVSSVQEWFLRFVQCLLLYGFVFEPLKCLIYVVLQLYNG
ncbi:unnamed protein product [Candidula unifasciata]|uniref:Uncharacterized protein n=1 Tax=Candidula unifasciata TaxID=100452 RepID=A0A8S4A1M2_9EUPU|nr:unnamed protein product [Candidula unifasciata]